ncbi:MAG TPA: hypothetical protein VK325_10310 [Pseudoxanthomonas sp.]|nr:hypothetical protein [Pseudoxanthomonas sp.]
MNRTVALWALALAMAAPAGCQRDSSTPEGDAVRQQPVPRGGEIGREAPDAAASPRPTVPGLHAQALVGRYSDGDTRLELRADGSYVQSLQAGGSTLSVQGRWSGAGPKALLLAPASASAKDVRFEVVSDLELRSADGTHTFRRARAP